MLDLDKMAADFEAARLIAFIMPEGCYRRAPGANYCGYRGRLGSFYVVGDSLTEIPKPDTYVGGKPALQVYK